jgi:hypothetical protein
MSAVTGRCSCGRVAWRGEGAPLWTTWCHCADCRRATGAPVTLWVGFAAAEITGPVRWRVGGLPSVQRANCGECGSPVGYRDDNLPPGEVYFTAGTADRPETLEPEGHAFFPARLPYVAADDDLPKFHGGSRPRL